MDLFPVLGIDIGGTKVALCLATSDGTILGKSRVDNVDRDAKEVLPQIVTEAKALLKQNELTTDDLKAIGICSPAPHDLENGVILTPFNMPGWRNVPIRDFLEKALETEAFMENDANAGALAEWFFGIGKKCKNLLYLTMSTGVGGGVILNGHLVQGTNHNAGEVGHMVLDIAEDAPICSCGQRGCFEAFSGGRAIALRVQEDIKQNYISTFIIDHADGDIDSIDMIAIEKAVKDQDKYAVKIWSEMSKRNAQGIGLLINALNPEMVVLGTLAWAAGDLFMKPLMEHIEKYTWPQMRETCQVVPSKLRREIGEYAGISVALNFLYERGEFDPFTDSDFVDV
ncbi:ROK family protein [Lentisphaerota bacterium WC36G]|nr:ROK family protein [Lentisphaerae bacterium WC36]